MTVMEFYENSLRENKKHLLVLKIKQHSCISRLQEKSQGRLGDI